MDLKEEMFGTFTAEAGQLFGMQILPMKESTEPDQIYLWPAQTLLAAEKDFLPFPEYMRN